MDSAGGVEFQLELNAKIDEAVGMIKELTKIQAAAIIAGKGLTDAEKKVGLLTRGFRAAKGELATFAREALAHFTALAAFEGLKRLGEGFVDLGREAFDAAGEAQRTRASFQLLMGVKPADDLLEYLDALSRHSQFTDGELKGMTAQLVRAGFAGEGLKKALAAARDAASFPGDAAANAADALNLLSKINLKGGVSERELVGAGLKPAEFFKRVADEVGGGIDSVKQRIQEGKIASEVLLGAYYESLQKKTGGKLGSADEAFSKTFDAQRKKVKDIVPNLFEELEKSGGLTGITKAMMKLSAALDPDSPNGQKIIKGLTEMLDKFAALIATADMDKFATRVTDFLTALPPLLKAATTALEAFGKAMQWAFFEKSPQDKAVSDVFHAANGDKAAAARATASQKQFEDFLTGRKAPGLFDMDPSKSGGVEWFPDLKKALRWMGVGGAGAPAGDRKIYKPSPIDSATPMVPNSGLMTPVDPTMSLPPMTPVTPVTPAPASSAGASVMRGLKAPSYAANVTVNVDGASGDEDERREFAEDIGAHTRRHMESLLERLQAEGSVG